MSSSTTSVGSSVRGCAEARQRASAAGAPSPASSRRRSIRPAAARLVAAPPHRRDRQRQLLGDALGELELGRRHRLEVGALQALAVGEGEGGLEVDLLVVAASLALFGGVGARRRAAPRRARFARGALAVSPRAAGSSAAAAPSSARAASGRARRRRTPASKIACCSWRSSITADSAAWTSSRCEKPTASIASSAAITRSGPTGTPGAAQHAGEVGDVLGEHRRRRRRWRVAVAARSSRRVTSALDILAMSSRCLSSTPSVSCTRLRIEADAC